MKKERAWAARSGRKGRSIFQIKAHTISGDKMNSIWTETVQLPRFEPLRGNVKADVLIVGGGITGILTAYALKEAGIPCILVEASRLCSGTTGRTTAKITSQHGLIYGKLLRKFGPTAAKMYWQANEEAIQRYEELAKKFPCDFERKPAFVYSLDGPDRLQQELEALDQLGIPAKDRAELELPMKTAGGVEFPNQAQFHPLKLLAGMVKDLTIYEKTAVQEFAGKTVRTAHGSITSEHIIVTTHFPLLNKHGAYFLKLYQNRSYVLALKHAQELNGMYLDEAESGLSFRGYGEYLLLGGGAHRTGKQGSGWNGLREFARQHYPGAEEVGAWAAQDCMTLDGMPYIGRYSRNTHHLYVATGFHKWGMSSAMVAAELLRDLIQGKKNPYERVFSPSRTMLHWQLLGNAFEAGKSLLTPSVPRCPHLGCALKWNPQERSWDCSCHGSRFAEDGSLLDNPATGDLKNPKG